MVNNRRNIIFQLFFFVNWVNEQKKIFYLLKELKQRRMIELETPTILGYYTKGEYLCLPLDSHV